MNHRQEFSEYELLIQGVTDYAIFMIDPDAQVTSWNSGAQRIKGYAAAEIIGENFAQFYTPEDRKSGLPLKALEIARREGRYLAEGWRTRKDGSRFWASVVIDAIYKQGTLVGFAKVTRDLSERRVAEQAEEKSRVELLQSQKMEAIGQLTGGIAHDFNNLLSAIMGNLDMISRRAQQGRYAELDRHLDAAHSAARRAAALTHRLLSFSRRQTLDTRRVDANKLISDMMDELIDRAIGPEVSARTKLARDLWATLCAPTSLKTRC